MANIPLKTITFPGLDDTYTVPQLDNTLAIEGDAAESSAVGAALDTKADKDGNYPDLTAGLADMATQLKSTVGITDEELYLFRTSGGSADIGDFETDKIIGGSVAWNQLIQALNSDNFSSQASTVEFSDGVATITASGNYGRLLIKSEKLPDVVAGHKYLIFAVCKTNFTHFFYPINIGVGSTSQVNKSTPAANTWKTYYKIYQASSNLKNYAYFGDVSDGYTSGDEVSVRNLQFFDLTQMFGTTIADYIYSLEQATEGAGIAWFRKLFPKPYYAYNPGTLIHVGNISKHKMVGFNAYDHATGKAKVVGGNAYQITGTYTALSLDGETVTPDSGGYFTPAESGEVTVTGGNATDTCIHLVWDGERDGEYAPYVAYEYPLDADFYLLGIPKLDANNRLYFDGDEYASDGTVTQRYGMVDLGSLNWLTRKYNENGNQGFYATNQIPGVAGTGSAYLANAICTKYTTVATGAIGQADVDKVIAIGAYWATGCNVYIIDSAYSDAATFKAAMSGIYLVYERANPMYAQVDPFENPQRVDDFGTEEYVAEPFGTNDVILPVGHSTFYQANLRAKLEMSPNSPDGDGDYIVRQANGENTYVPLVIPPAVQVVEKFIEFSPAVSVAAGDVYSTYNDNITPEVISGYTPKMVTVKGTNSLALIPLCAYISSDNSRIMVDLRNVTDQAVSLTSLAVDVLYVKS